MAFWVSARLPATSTKLSATGDDGIGRFCATARKSVAIAPAMPATTARRVGLDVITLSSLLILSKTWTRSSTRSVDVRLGGGAAECSLEEIKVAALMRLHDVAAEHPAITALISGRRRLKRHAPTGKLGVGNLKTDAPRGHVDRDGITGPDQRQRAADI